MVDAGSELDHIVIVAPDLTIGADYVRNALGVTPQAGGTHARMGTHNLLLRIGDTVYLEVIAVDPAAPSARRARWFGMDHRDPRAPPALTTWVARTRALDSLLARCRHDPGEALPMSRGALNWRITVPGDGALPEGGLLPTLIEWHTAQHPATTLPDSGVRLEALVLRHPEPERFEPALAAIGCAGPLRVEGVAPGTPGSLEARFATPAGPRMLSSGAAVS